MELTVLGYVIIPVVLIITLVHTEWLLYLIILLAPLKTASVININSISFGLQPGYFAAIVWMIYVFWRSFVRGKLIMTPMTASAIRPLLLFVVWAFLSAFIMPFLLLSNSIYVYPPEAGLTAQSLTPLAYNRTNLTQCLYLLFLVGVALAICQDVSNPKRLHKCIIMFIISGILVAVWGIYQIIAYYNGWPQFEHWFYNNISFTQGYNRQVLPGGYKRFLSFLGEPSMCAHFMAAYTGLALGLILFKFNCWSKCLRITILLIGLGALMATTSSTAFLTLGFWFLSLTAYTVYRKQVLKQYLIVVSVIAVAFGFILGSIHYTLKGDPGLLSKLLRYLTIEKILTPSGQERLQADLHSLDLLLESGGLGVGWGSNRPSSFATYILSNVGIVGFALFVWFSIKCQQIVKRISSLVPGSWIAILARSLALGIVWILTVAIIAVPDIIFLYWWILIGLLLSISNMSLRNICSNE